MNAVTTRLTTVILHMTTLLLCPLFAMANGTEIGEFRITMEVQNNGKGPYLLDPTKADPDTSRGNILNSKRVGSYAKVFYTPEHNLQIIFNKPLVLHLIDSEQKNTAIERLIPSLTVQLSERQRTHFEMIYIARNIDLVATMDVLDYELDFLKELKNLSRLSPKDYSDGRFFRIPVISKILKELNFPFVELHELTTSRPTISRTNIELQGLEVAQINSQTRQISTREGRTITLAENMAGLSSLEAEVQELIRFRTSAFHGYETRFDRFHAMPNTQEDFLPPASAKLLSLPSLRCRMFLKGNAGNPSGRPSAEIISFPFGGR